MYSTLHSTPYSTLYSTLYGSVYSSVEIHTCRFIVCCFQHEVSPTSVLTYMILCYVRSLHVHVRRLPISSLFLKDNGKNKGKTNGDGKLNAAKPQFSDKSTARDIVHWYAYERISQV